MTRPEVLGWALFALGAVSLLLTLNVLSPVKWPSWAALISFFAGWLVGELAIHHVAFQLVVACALAHAGPAMGWPTQSGALLLVVSWALLVREYALAGRAAATMESALVEALGEGSSAPASAHSWTALAVPTPWRRGVSVTPNIVFWSEGKRRLRLDVFRSTALPERAPTLVYVHGGGWVVGQRRAQGLPLMFALAARGFTCVSIDYRLSPRATFPDHLIDVKRALAWVREHADEHGVDREFIVIAGNSAGAHLASLAALTPNDPAYQPGFEEADTRVSACLPFYGVFDFSDRHGHWPHGGMKVMLELVVMKARRDKHPARFDEASPITRVTEGAPPFFVVHGDRDTLAPVDESRRFVEALREKSGSPVAYAEIAGAQHAFEIFPSRRSLAVVDGVVRYLETLASRRASP